jgi:hypothetical protein
MEMTGNPGGVINDGSGYRGWGLVASGVNTGIDHRVTNSMKTFRFIIYPKVPVTGFCFMTQKGGLKATASRVKVYRIDSELPALEVASPDYRYTGQHLERISLIPMTFLNTNDEYKFAVTYCNSMHRGFYKNWYNSIANMIKYMRFSGENMLIAGMYMYSPDVSPYWKTKEMANSAELLGRMCDANGIKVLLGVEYSRPEGGTFQRYTDAEVAAGADTIMSVDKTGKQVTTTSDVANMMVPAVENDMKSVVEDLCTLYGDTPGIAGIAFQEGIMWTPGFGQASGSTDPLDTGYDDATISAFEADTSIDVPISDTSTTRFADRYAWIMANALTEWITWRNARISGLNSELSDIITTANPNWTMSVFPSVTKNRNLGTPEQQLQRAGYDASSYGSTDILFSSMYTNGVRPYQNGVAPLLKEREWSQHPDVIGVTDEQGGYVNNGFFEMTQTSSTWYYDLSLCCDYVWQSGRDFLYPFSQVMSRTTPSIMAQTWLDVNMMGGFEQERREFNRAFRVLPPGPYTTLTGSGLDTNLVVRSAVTTTGSAFYVVNPAGWPVTVTLGYNGTSIRDLGTGDTLAASGGEITFTMQEYGIRSFEITGAYALTGASVSVLSAYATDLASYSAVRGQDYDALPDIASDRVNDAIDLLGLYRTETDLRAQGDVIADAVSTSDWLAVASKTDTYGQFFFEGFLWAMKSYLTASDGLPEWAPGYGPLSQVERIDYTDYSSRIDGSGRFLLLDRSVSRYFTVPMVYLNFNGVPNSWSYSSLRNNTSVDGWDEVKGALSDVLGGRQISIKGIYEGLCVDMTAVTNDSTVTMNYNVKTATPSSDIYSMRVYSSGFPYGGTPLAVTYEDNTMANIDFSVVPTIVNNVKTFQMPWNGSMATVSLQFTNAWAKLYRASSTAYIDILISPKSTISYPMTSGTEFGFTMTITMP